MSYETLNKTVYYIKVDQGRKVKYLSYTGRLTTNMTNMAALDSVSEAEDRINNTVYGIKTNYPDIKDAEISINEYRL